MKLYIVVLFLCYIARAVGETAKVINVDIPNSLMLIGRTEQFINELNEDSIKFIKATYKRDSNSIPMTPQEFKRLYEGEWENIEHETISPIRLMRIGKHSSNSVELQSGVFIGCIPYGSQAIPAPRSHSAGFFEAEMKNNTKYYDEDGLLVAITSTNHTACTNGVTLYVPDKQFNEYQLNGTMNLILASLDAN